MFNIFISGSLFTAAYYFLKNNRFLIDKYNNIKRLYNLVSTRHSSPIIITLISLKMIFQSFYIEFQQYINNTIVKIDKNKYLITYIINGRTYKMIITPCRGPINILNIINDENKNITDEILPYLGHNNDWNNYKFNPKFFGYKSLTFELINGENITFYGEDTIVI